MGTAESTRGTGKHTCFTLRVFQTETGLVSLSYLGPIEVQEIVVGENLHAVVVPARHRRGEPSLGRADTPLI